MSRSAGLAVLMVIFASSPTIAQDQPPVTANQIMANAEKVYGPPPPEPECAPQEGDEIVVCAREQDNSQFRVKSSSELDPGSEEALYDGIPRAPDFAESCKKNPEKGPCIGFGRVPPPAYFINFDDLPEAPEGSDADKIAKGEMPAR